MPDDESILWTASAAATPDLLLRDASRMWAAQQQMADWLHMHAQCAMSDQNVSIGGCAGLCRAARVAGRGQEPGQGGAQAAAACGGGGAGTCQGGVRDTDGGAVPRCGPPYLRLGGGR